MLCCKQVARALADHRYWELPWHRRVGLMIHVHLCVVCGQYHRHVMLMQDVAQGYAAHELSDPPGRDLKLPSDARERILKNIKDAGR